MVAFGVTVKVLPFFINPRQGIFGWVYDCTNAQQHERLGSVGNKSVQHTPWQDDTLMQVHHTQFAAMTECVENQLPEAVLKFLSYQ